MIPPTDVVAAGASGPGLIICVSAGGLMIEKHVAFVYGFSGETDPDRRGWLWAIGGNADRSVAPQQQPYFPRPRRFTL